MATISSTSDPLLSPAFGRVGLRAAPLVARRRPRFLVFSAQSSNRACFPPITR